MARQTQPGGDVILKALDRAVGTWLDRFTPATATEVQDATLYIVEIGGVPYRLVGSVMAIPAGFRYFSQDGIEAPMH